MVVFMFVSYPNKPNLGYDLNLNVQGYFRSYFRLYLNVQFTLLKLGDWKSFLKVFLDENRTKNTILQ